MRVKLILLLVLIASMAVGQDYFGNSTSPIVRSWHFNTLNEAPMSASGDALDVACAAPPYLNMGIGYGQPFLLAPSTNTTIVGSWGIYGAGAISNFIQRAIFTSWTATTPDGWSKAETAGDGSAAITQESTIIAAGSSSVKMVLTGDTSVAQISSACMTDGIAGDIYVSAWAKKTVGTSRWTMFIREYDAADCSGGSLQDDYIKTNIDISSDWTKQSDVLAAATWHADTSSYRLYIVEGGNGGVTIYTDAVQLREASTPTDAFCGADTDATAACNLNDMTTTPPESMVGTWEFEATVRSPVDGGAVPPVRQILKISPTAGNNNRVDMFINTDALYCDVYDSAGVRKQSTVLAAGNADTDYVVKMSKSASGVVQCCFSGTCDATPATGAITDGIGSELVFGSSGSANAEVWVQDPVIRRRLTE